MDFLTNFSYATTILNSSNIIKSITSITFYLLDNKTHLPFNKKINYIKIVNFAGCAGGSIIYVNY